VTSHAVRRAGTAALGLAALLAVVPATPASASTTFVSDTFSRSDGLVTNAYAYSSATSRTAVHDGRWQMTSGSLLARSGTGWTGVPDAGAPGATSSPYNGSAVFRMRSHRTDIRDAAVDFRLRTDRFVSTSRTPAQQWDGVHVWLRYRSETDLYVVSVNRRNDTIQVKRKVPGGTTNGGTYVSLGDSEPFPTPLGRWQSWSVSARNAADGSVVLEAKVDGRLVLRQVDSGVRLPDGRTAAPLRYSGRVGIRGDNTEFRLDDLAIRQLSSTTPPRHTVVSLGTASTTIRGNTIDMTARAWRDGVPLQGATVRLQYRVPGGSWTDAVRGTTSSSGRVVMRTLVGATAQWRTKVNATSTAPEAVSAVATVTAR
jgi:hypothetical protein